jgi:hypothetical protein
MTGLWNKVFFILKKEGIPISYNIPGEIRDQSTGPKSK